MREETGMTMDREMTAGRFAMAVTRDDGTRIDVTIDGSGLTYARSGAITGGAVVTVALVLHKPGAGEVKTVWYPDMTDAAKLAAVTGKALWNHPSALVYLADELSAAFRWDCAGLAEIEALRDAGAVEQPPGRTLSGTEGDDRLAGTEAGEKIWGRGGDDRLRGEGGNDSLQGGTGQDRMRGGDGDDAMGGNTGDDRMRGDRGSDTLDGGSGDDRLRGDAGDDLLVDLSGNNRMRGGSGDDTLRSGKGNDVMIGNAGDDLIVAGGGRDFAMGNAGADTFRFGSDSRGELIIKAFEAADRFDLGGVGSAEAEFGQFLAEAREAGGNVIWQHGAMTVVLLDTRIADIGLQNFAGADLI